MGKILKCLYWVGKYLFKVVSSPFHSTGRSLYPLKILENLWFSDVLRGYRNRPVAWLRHQNKLCCFTYFMPLVSFRSSHQRCSIQKGVLRNFTKFAGKHQCQSLFFNEVAGLKLYWKRDSGTSVYLWILWNFQKFLFS